MADHIYPNERRFYQEAERLGPWAALPVVEAGSEAGRNRFQRPEARRDDARAALAGR
jgi:hypothetical protein